MGAELSFCFSDSLHFPRMKEWLILAGELGRGVIAPARPLPSGSPLDPGCPQAARRLPSNQDLFLRKVTRAFSASVARWGTAGLPLPAK